MACIKYEIQAKYVKINSVYHGFEHTLGDSGGQRSLAGYSPMGSQRVRYNLATEHAVKLSGESRVGSQGLKNGLREQRKETGLNPVVRG